MRTKEEFLQAFKDELLGMILAGFEDQAASRGDFNAKGRAVTGAMYRASGMLDRMYEFLHQPVKPSMNGVPGPMMGVKR